MKESLDAEIICDMILVMLRNFPELSGTSPHHDVAAALSNALGVLPSIS